MQHREAYHTLPCPAPTRTYRTRVLPIICLCSPQSYYLAALLLLLCCNFLYPLPCPSPAASFLVSAGAQSFVFTFPDHDGSVAAAAAILPRAAATIATALQSNAAHSSDEMEPCAARGRGCRYPVLLALSGVGVKVRGQADSHKFKASPSDQDYTFGFPDAWILSPQRGKEGKPSVSERG